MRKKHTKKSKRFAVCVEQITSTQMHFLSNRCFAWNSLLRCTTLCIARRVSDTFFFCCFSMKKNASSKWKNKITKKKKVAMSDDLAFNRKYKFINKYPRDFLFSLRRMRPTTMTHSLTFLSRIADDTRTWARTSYSSHVQVSIYA